MQWVILKTVSSIGELLGSFDVDCAAVCYDCGADRAWMTTRAKRAFEFKCNIVDMNDRIEMYRHNINIEE